MLSSGHASAALSLADGVHAPAPRSVMSESVRRRRDAYNLVPGAAFYRCEFWLMPGTIERWKKEGFDEQCDQDALFGFDKPGHFQLWNLGWCEAPFYPAFETKILEDLGETEIEQDFAGRHVRYFKGRRVGFMPEYVDHPVKDMKTWCDNVKWRLDPTTPQRHLDAEYAAKQAIEAAGRGLIITEGLIGGYMYLRSLMGPEGALYNFIDQPELIHECMKTWLEVSDAIIAHHQKFVTIEEIFFAEDICYKGGPLISPDMIREFLMPYYQQLIANLKTRQIDKNRHLWVQVDTDGNCKPVIDLYHQGIGMDSMSPFEVASGSDVVPIGRQYPNLIMRGGIDKRILAKSKKDIDAMVESIFPIMRERGGYIPCVDHGTPEEVSFENYLHFRKRCLELGG